MRKSRFTPQQIVGTLREVETSPIVYDVQQQMAAATVEVTLSPRGQPSPVLPSASRIPLGRDAP
jgi:hypothetical protein